MIPLGMIRRLRARAEHQLARARRRGHVAPPVDPRRLLVKLTAARIAGSCGTRAPGATKARRHPHRRARPPRRRAAPRQTGGAGNGSGAGAGGGGSGDGDGDDGDGGDDDEDGSRGCENAPILCLPGSIPPDHARAAVRALARVLVRQALKEAPTVGALGADEDSTA